MLYLSDGLIKFLLSCFRRFLLFLVLARFLDFERFGILVCLQFGTPLTEARFEAFPVILRLLIFERDNGGVQCREFACKLNYALLFFVRTIVYQVGEGLRAQPIGVAYMVVCPPKSGTKMS